jgi:hypothetical protein
VNPMTVEFAFVERRPDLLPLGKSRKPFRIQIDIGYGEPPTVSVVGQYAEDMSPDECRRLAAALVDAANEADHAL